MSYNGDKRYAKRERSRTRKIALDWGLVAPSLIGTVVQLLGGAGVACLFGSSSDGGILSLTTYAEGDKERFYIRTAKEVPDVFMEVIEFHCSQAAVDTLEALLLPPEDKDTRKPPKTA